MGTIKLSDPLPGADEDDPSFALYTACENGDFPGAKAALRAGADPDHVGANGGRPLAHAAYAGDRALSKLLLSFGAEPIDMVIDAALSGGNIGLAEFLRNQVTSSAQRKQKKESQGRRLHEEHIAERKARVAALELQHEQRDRGERLAHQMEKIIDHQLAIGARLAAKESKRDARDNRLESYAQRRAELAAEKEERRRELLTKTEARHAAERAVEARVKVGVEASRRRTYEEKEARLHHVRPPLPMTPQTHTAILVFAPLLRSSCCCAAYAEAVDRAS